MSDWRKTWRCKQCGCHGTCDLFWFCRNCGGQTGEFIIYRNVLVRRAAWWKKLLGLDRDEWREEVKR